MRWSYFCYLNVLVLLFVFESYVYSFPFSIEQNVFDKRSSSSDAAEILFVKRTITERLKGLVGGGKKSPPQRTSSTKYFSHPNAKVAEPKMREGTKLSPDYTLPEHMRSPKPQQHSYFDPTTRKPVTVGKKG